MTLLRKAVDRVAADRHCGFGVIALVANQALVGFGLVVNAETGEVEPFDGTKLIAAGDEVAFDGREGFVLADAVRF